jgi:hypothetical protein
MDSPRSWFGIAVLACVVGAIVSAESQIKKAEKTVPQVLNDRTLSHWRTYIHPSVAESAWESPGWRTSLWSGLTAAQEKKKPLLFWSMTGHPCGMT